MRRLIVGVDLTEVDHRTVVERLDCGVEQHRDALPPHLGDHAPGVPVPGPAPIGTAGGQWRLRRGQVEQGQAVGHQAPIQLTGYVRFGRRMSGGDTRCGVTG